jgi:hypothetical protein
VLLEDLDRDELGVRPGAASSDEKVAGPNLRVARVSDYPQIARLEARHGMRARSFEEWSHRWLNNPVYKELHNWPIGWIFETEGGAIVGHMANVPLSYTFGYKGLLGAAACDLVVDKQYRFYAFRLLGCFLSQRNVDILVSTTANAVSERALKTFRALRVPVGNWNEAAFWVTDRRGFLGSLLRKKHVPLATVLKVPLSLGLRLMETANQVSTAVPYDGNFQVAECDQFDDGFNVFWNNVIADRPGTLLGTRTRNVLQWHFKYALEEKRAWIVKATQGTKMVAFAIFFQCDVTEYRLRRWRIIDFQALEGRNEALIPMLAWALKRCQREGIHMLEAVGFASEKQSIIERFAPYRRQLSSWCYFYKATSSELAKSLTKPEAWDPSCFDGDASL